MIDVAADARTSIEARKGRWRRFLDPDAPPGFLFLVNYPDPDAPTLGGFPYWPDRARERIDSALRGYEWQLKRSEWIHDDRVPHLSNTTGTEIFAEALGCPVERPDDNMPYARPCVRTARDAEGIKVPRLEESSLAYLFDIADKTHSKAGPEAVMQLVDVQSPMDVAALVWNKEDLFIAMVEQPEAVKDLAAKARELMVAFFDEWFRRYGGEFISHFPEYFMSGGFTLSEDEVGAVSPEQMRDFFVPELENLSKRYGGLGIHCCADASHQWENFSALPGLRAMNFVTPPRRSAQVYIRESFEHFGNRCVHVPSWTPSGDMHTWADQAPDGLRLVLSFRAESRDEAVALAGELNDHPRRFRDARGAEVDEYRTITARANAMQA